MHIFMTIILLFFILNNANSQLTQISSTTLVDSEESFERRLYAYDFDVDSNGTIHVVYSKPVAGEDRTQIIYMSKLKDASWPAETERNILEENGLLASVSTHIIVDNNNDVHISYIVNRDFVDTTGFTHAQGLVYQKISNGSIVQTSNVSPGGFHTQMQLDNENLAIFAREYEIFINDDGSFKTAPYPRAIRIQLPLSDNSWTDREYILDLPDEEYYRLADFIYDKKRNKYHITYGNKNAVSLAAKYPTTNPPSTSGSVFPDGSGHQLKYASSSDLKTWQTSTIDDSGNLSENEFWTDLLVDEYGLAYASSYIYKTDSFGIHQGTSNIFAYLKNDNTWGKQTIAGKTTGASPHRAGMGTKIMRDAQGGFHGIWDNSPDAPIDNISSRGSTIYRYSPFGANWTTRQTLLETSAEGKIRAKIADHKLYLLALTDYSNARLVFSEFQLPQPESIIFEISSDKMFYGLGEAIQLHVRMQGDDTTMTDIYLVVAGPYDVSSNGDLISNQNTSIKYMNNKLQWQSINQINDAQAVISNFHALDFNGFFLSLSAKSTIPFNFSARYRIYSYALQTGTKLDISNSSQNMVAPPYNYDIHVCNLQNCADIK